MKAKFVSVWDIDLRSGRGYEIITDCQINLETGHLEIEKCSEEEMTLVDNLDREYVELDGERFQLTEGEMDPSVVGKWLAQMEKKELQKEGCPLPFKNKKRF